MKRILIMIMIFSICFSSIFFAAAQDNIKETVLTVAHTAVEGQYHPYNVGLAKMQQILDEKTNGKIKLKIYAGGSLTGDESEMLTLIKNDALDICTPAPNYLTSYEPFVGIIGLPYMFKNLDMIGPIMYGELGEVLNPKLEAQGFTILAWWTGVGFRSVNNSLRPIYTPKDMEGMKMRVMPDPVSVDTFSAFGAITTPVSWGELHTALQTKTVDAHENNPQVIANYGFIELGCKYYSLTEHTNYAIPVIIGTKQLNALGEEAKNILFEAARGAEQAVRECADTSIAEAYASIEAQGGEINEVDKDAFIEAAKPIIDKYKKEYGEEGARIIDLIMSK